MQSYGNDYACDPIRIPHVYSAYSVNFYSMNQISGLVEFGLNHEAAFAEIGEFAMKVGRGLRTRTPSIAPSSNSPRLSRMGRKLAFSIGMMKAGSQKL